MLCGAKFLQTVVDFGEHTAECLAIGEQVTVVVDEYRYAELLLKERAERNTLAERGEVWQVAADDAVRVVGWAGEREADCHGFLLQLVEYLTETVYHVLQTQVKVV